MVSPAFTNFAQNPFGGLQKGLEFNQDLLNAQYAPQKIQQDLAAQNAQTNYYNTQQKGLEADDQRKADEAAIKVGASVAAVLKDLPVDKRQQYAQYFNNKLGLKIDEEDLTDDAINAVLGIHDKLGFGLERTKVEQKQQEIGISQDKLILNIAELRQKIAESTTKEEHDKWSNELKSRELDLKERQFTVESNPQTQWQKDNTFRRQVTNDITTLIQPAVDTYNSYTALDALQETSTGADQLAAIFLFMKALDPRSVVREGEQQQAAATGGVTDQFLGYVQHITSGGKLTPSQFEDMKNTAKTMASQQIENVQQNVRGNLNGYMGVPQDFYNAQINRIPTITSKIDAKNTSTEDLINRKNKLLNKAGGNNQVQPQVQQPNRVVINQPNNPLNGRTQYNIQNLSDQQIQDRINQLKAKQ